MSLDSHHPVEAKRINNTLVAAFPRANPPLVWRFDLERNHSFSLALQGEDGEWELGLTSPKGDFQPVARFAMREDAEDAFIRIERILSKRETAWFKLILKTMSMIVLLAIVGFIISLVTKSHKQTVDVNPLGSAINPNVMIPSPAPPKVGVPVPADEFFKSGE